MKGVYDVKLKDARDKAHKDYRGWTVTSTVIGEYRNGYSAWNGKRERRVFVAVAPRGGGRVSKNSLKDVKEAVDWLSLGSKAEKYGTENE